MKQINKRLNSAIKYVDSIIDNHSKVNTIRLDFGYNKPYSDKVTIEEANKDLNHLFNNTRSKPTIFKDMVGHMVKREYTKDKGVHFHALFFFDGQKVLKDSYKAEEIGKYWQDTIVKDKGSYHNCNRNKYEQNGIGMLDHTDSTKKKVLCDNVLPYLCKDDQDIQEIKQKTNTRAFTRGKLLKSKGNIGRPRG